MKRCLPICLLLLSFSAHGALNKWVDADGNVHYSDEPPPPNVKATVLIVPPPASGVPAPKTIAEREAERKKALKAKEEAEQKTAKQQEQTQNREEDCKVLRANLATLENSPRIITYNAKGESVTMDEDTRQQQLGETRHQIRTHCE